MDQLDQLVAIDHFARRDGDRSARRVGLGAGRRLAAHRASRILDQVTRSLPEAEPTAFQQPLLEDRIGGGEVGGRDRVEQLAGGELDHRLMVPRHAMEPGRGRVPPLLLEQKGLRDQIEGRTPPGGIIEAMVLRQRDDRRFGIFAGRDAHGIVGQPTDFSRRLHAELELLAWGEGEMRPPVCE